MQRDEITAIFEQQAANYDTQWAGMAPIRDGLYFLLPSVMADLPDEARILCVGAGTGLEMAYLARLFPRWRFTAVEPSGAMLEICRQRAAAEGFADRCEFHLGFLDSMAPQQPYDGATCLLVSQFIVSTAERTEFFRGIGERLKPGGLLVSSDLAADVGSPAYEALLRVWIHVMSAKGVTPELLEQTRAAYASKVAILPPAAVGSLLKSAGFEHPVQFFQSGLMHAWFAGWAPRL